MRKIGLTVATLLWFGCGSSAAAPEAVASDPVASEPAASDLDVPTPVDPSPAQPSEAPDEPRVAPAPDAPTHLAPLTPALGDVQGSCALTRFTTPAHVGRGHHPVRIAVGENGPLVTWLSESIVHALALEPDGTARGEEHDVQIPASSDMSAPYLRDAGFWLEPTTGGFIVATQVGRRRNWHLHVHALGPDGSPIGDPVSVETSRTPEESFRVVAAASGVYVLHPRSARFERYTISDGALVREVLGETDGANGRSFALIDRERSAVLMQRLRAFVLRLSDGSEVALEGFPHYRRMLDMGFDGERLVFVYETTEGRRRPSWALTASLEGALGEPLSIRRDTPLPPPFSARVRVFALERMTEQATSPMDTYHVIERQNTAGWRVGEPILHAAEDVAWTGSHFLAVNTVLRDIQVCTVTCSASESVSPTR